jgi:hypothetical protein
VSEVKPARSELVAWAAATRNLEWAEALDGALMAALAGGWAWSRAASFACRLVLDSGADPRDLLNAVRQPGSAGARPAPPTPEWEAAKAALEAIQAQRGDGAA